MRKWSIVHQPMHPFDFTLIKYTQSQSKSAEREEDNPAKRLIGWLCAFRSSNTMAHGPICSNSCSVLSKPRSLSAFFLRPDTRDPFGPRRIAVCGPGVFDTNNAEAVSRSLPPPAAAGAPASSGNARVEIFARLPPSSVQQRCYSRQQQKEIQLVDRRAKSKQHSTLSDRRNKHVLELDRLGFLVAFLLDRRGKSKECEMSARASEECVNC